MSSADLWEDGFPHGTVQGYHDGCRGGACPGELDYGMSCKRANTLNNGDYRYKKLAAAGKTPAEIAAALDRGDEPTSPPAPRPPTPAQPLAERARDAEPQEAAGEEPASEREAPTDDPIVEPVAEAEAMGHPDNFETFDPILTTAPWTEGLGATAKRRRIAEIRDWCRDHGHIVPTKGKIRDWCRDHGHIVPTKGKIPVTALTAYAAAFPPGAQPARDLVEEGRVLASERDDLIAAGADPHELEVPLHPDTIDIAHRSDLLDETRDRIEPKIPKIPRLAEGGVILPTSPPMVTKEGVEHYVHFHTGPPAELSPDELELAYPSPAALVAVEPIKSARPEWPDVTIPEDIERLRNLAARLEQELAHTEEERDQALAEAASAQRAMITAILRWDETAQINDYLQLLNARLRRDLERAAEWAATLTGMKLRDARVRRRDR